MRLDVAMASVKFALLGVLVACGGDKHDSTDAPQNTAECDGTSDRFLMTGPIAVDTNNFGFVTVGGKIAGLGGSASTDVVSFVLRNGVANDLESDRDVANANLMYFREPLAGCGDCTGFYALAGSYHVVSLAPRYEATFTLSDLHERHAAQDPPGASIAGTITGCVNHAPP